MLLQLYLFTIAVTYSRSQRLSSVASSYKKGMEAYNGERWSECITQFEGSLHLYKLYKTIIINCRFQCNSKVDDPQHKEDIEGLKMYEQFFKTKNCLNKCESQGLQHVNLIDDLEDSMIINMQLRKPYEFLHICYYQMNALPKAASAAYTYFVVHQEDESMKENIHYYIKQPEVDIKEVVDLLGEDFEVMYKLGHDAYGKSNWAETVASMEEVLTDYISWENTCRIECERQPQQDWSPEITITISNTLASLLYCKQQCQDRVAKLGYNSGPEFLADVLNYIQISYYHLDRIRDAAKALTSYLILMPDDEHMLENKAMYETLATNDAFNGRSDIDYYSKRDNYEKELLKLFHGKSSSHDIDSNTI